MCVIQPSVSSPEHDNIDNNLYMHLLFIFFIFYFFISFNCHTQFHTFIDILKMYTWIKKKDWNENFVGDFDIKCR